MEEVQRQPFLSVGSASIRDAVTLPGLAFGILQTSLTRQSTFCCLVFACLGGELRPKCRLMHEQHHVTPGSDELL